MSESGNKSQGFTQTTLAILTDMQSILRQGSNLLSYDTKGVSRSARETILLLMAALGTLLVGSVLTSFAVAYGLVALMPSIPLWGPLGGIGLLLLVSGSALYFGARAKLDTLLDLGQQSSAVSDELARAAEHMSEAIEGTKQAIVTTTDSMGATYENIRKAADLPYQVEQRPLAMFAGAASVGLIGGLLLNAATARTSGPVTRSQYVHPFSPNAATHPSASLNHRADATTESEESGLFSKLGEMVMPQAGLLREIAVGSLFGLARDWARNSLDKQFEQPVNDFFDDASRRFGGRPMPAGQPKPAQQASRNEPARPMAQALPTSF